MDYDALIDSSIPRGARRQRVFLSNRDDQGPNVDIWRSGMAAALAGDGVGMVHALTHARGDARPYGRGDKPRRDPISKAILKLSADPQAWRRFRTGAERFGIFDDEATAQAEWKPYSVNLLSFMWAANPQAFPAAARAWREQCLAKDQWWSCPFLIQPWEERVQLSWIFQRVALGRRRGADTHPMPLGAPGSSASEADALDSEREALDTLCVEIARGCIESVGRYASKDREAREQGKKIWARGGHSLGLGWTHILQDPDSATMNPPVLTVSERAVDAIMADALAHSLDEGRATAARLALSLDDMENGALSLRAIKVLVLADPHGDLPFGAHDWLEPRLVARLDCSDDQLARLLAGAGRSWSVPGGTSYAGGLSPGYPAWSHRHEAWRQTDSSKTSDFKHWTILEWMLLMGRPEAARRACLLGAKLAPHFESVIGEALGWSYQTPKRDALVFAEACRIAESIHRPESALPCAPSRPAARL